MITSSDISIVIQGPIDENSIVDVSNSIEIYRDIFPESEIICVFSCFNIFKYNKLEKAPFINENYKDNYYVNASFSRIKSMCDKVLLCHDAIYLPPIKNDTGRFHGNHQIEAAQLGLKNSTRKYVLRVRNDAVFCSTKIVDIWDKFKSIKRGAFSVFDQRILISSAFTLNPYSLERFPFHWSDWFHFGLTKDVQALWDCSYISAKDSLFYKYTPHENGSFELERRFFSRRAIEQHVNFSFFKKHFPQLRLNYTNDCFSLKESTRILKDNFIICDPYECDFIFDKYKECVSYTSQKESVITHSLWLRLLECDVDHFPKVLPCKRPEIFIDENASSPRTYRANNLFTKIGAHVNNRIIINAPYTDGVLVFGPHVSLPQGKYKVSCVFDSCTSHHGHVNIRATLEQGKIELFSASPNLDNIPLGSDPHVLDFYFENNSLSTKEFEIVVTISNIEDLSFKEFTLHRLATTRQLEKRSAENETYTLNYNQLSLPLRFILRLQMPFLTENKKNKLLKNTFRFLAESKTTLSKILLKFYLLEDKNRRK